MKNISINKVYIIYPRNSFKISNYIEMNFATIRHCYNSLTFFKLKKKYLTFCMLLRQCQKISTGYTNLQMQTETIPKIQYSEIENIVTHEKHVENVFLPLYIVSFLFVFLAYFEFNGLNEPIRKILCINVI